MCLRKRYTLDSIHVMLVGDASFLYWYVGSWEAGDTIRFTATQGTQVTPATSTPIFTSTFI